MFSNFKTFILNVGAALTLSFLIFLNWTLPFLNLNLSTDLNRVFSVKSKTEWQTV